MSWVVPDSADLPSHTKIAYLNDFQKKFSHHQEFQVPKMEVLNLIRLFCGWVSSYISRIHTAFIGEDSSTLGTWSVEWGHHQSHTLPETSKALEHWLSQKEISSSKRYVSFREGIWIVPVQSSKLCIVVLRSKNPTRNIAIGSFIEDQYDQSTKSPWCCHLKKS